MVASDELHLEHRALRGPGLVEGVDWARRFRRHELFDDSLARTNEVAHTAIIAPHGGGIEPGTSELCLAVAGYHPATLPQTPPAGVTYDYWMFEGLRPSGQRQAPRHLHRLRRRDRPLAVRGALHALALHGFRPDPGDDTDVLVGGATKGATGPCGSPCWTR